MWRRVAVALAAIFATARADAPSSLEVMEVEVTIDGRAVGPSIVYSDQRALWLRADVLCEARLCVEGGIDRGGTRYVDLAAVRGVARYKLDAEAGTVAIALAPEALPVTRIDLVNRAPAELEQLAAPSLFINYAVGGAALHDADDFELHGFAESGLAVHGVLAYSAVAFPDAEHAVRGISNLEIDRPGSLMRITAGDDVVSTGELGGAGVIGGIHVASDFALDPYFVSQPTLTHQGVVVAPSTLEVYRNGQLVRREALPTGPYQLDHIRSVEAADAQIVVRNPLGVAQVVARPTIAPPATALAPGLVQYAYSAGFVRRSLASESFEYGAPALLAMHRRGITPALTVGMRGEAMADRASLGTSATASLGRLGIDASASVSASDAGPSAAAALDIGGHFRSLTLASVIRAVGRHYATLELAPDDSRTTLEAQALAAWSPTSTSSLAFQIGAEQRTPGATRVRGSLAAGLQYGDTRVAASVGASDTGGLRTLDVSIAITHSIGRRTTGSASVQHAGDGDSISGGLQRVAVDGKGAGYDAGVRLGQTATGHARGVYEHGYGRATASVEWLNGVDRAAIDVAGGLVALGGRVKPTRPVQGSFALVRVPGAPGVAVAVDNHVAGTTDARGDLVVTELQPYYGSQIRIDPSHLPLDVTTTDLERTIATPRRAGAIVAFGSSERAMASGTIAATRDGEPFDVSYGELVIDGAVRAPIGHAGAFEVEALAPGRHRAVVDADGARCTIELAIPRDRRLVQLGEVACHIDQGAP